MTVAALLALLAVPLLAAGTPRQATLLFRGDMDVRGRKRMRAIGWIMMACSLASLLAGGPDRARQAIALLELMGMEAIGLAVAIPLRASLRVRVRKTVRPVRFGDRSARSSRLLRRLG